jgi:hypothetical protein
MQQRQTHLQAVAVVVISVVDAVSRTRDGVEAMAPPHGTTMDSGGTVRLVGLRRRRRKQPARRVLSLRQMRISRNSRRMRRNN